MKANMMQKPLLVKDIIEYAKLHHPQGDIVTNTVEGGIHRYTYGELYQRAKKMSGALLNLGVKKDDIIATLAWNTYRHLELYFSISCLGAIIHTINPRLFEKQLDFIIKDANDKFIFLDVNLVPLVEKLAPALANVKGYIIMSDQNHMPKTTLKNVHCYETLIHEHDDNLQWPDFDENQACALCYTSGTTGNPKGVLYSHRSTILHTFMVQALAFRFDETSSILPIVPLFHANGWGTPYIAVMMGFKYVLPGPHLDGQSLATLIRKESVSWILGVPTVWLALLDYLRETSETLPSLKFALIGGAAPPKSMIIEFAEKHNVYVVQGWGMTEMSPIGTVSPLLQDLPDLTRDEIYELEVLAGKPVFGTEYKIIDKENKELKPGDEGFGRLLTKGYAIVERYFKQKQSGLENGWFNTGDIAFIDKDYYVHIVDRDKDVIKSGGEWISSIEVENTALGHPDVKISCVIGAQHEKWDERPLLFVVLHAGKPENKANIMAYLKKKMSNWWLPDDIVFVKELPYTATGKLDKKVLKDQYSDYFLEDKHQGKKPAA